VKLKNELEIAKRDREIANNLASEWSTNAASNDNMRKAAAKDNTTLRKERDAWVEEKLDVMQQKRATDNSNYKLTVKQKQLEASKETDRKRIAELEEEAKARSQAHSNLLQSYETLKGLVDEIQAGKIVKICQDCPALREQLRTAENEKAAAEGRVAELNAAHEETIRKNSADYRELESKYSASSQLRDKYLEDLGNANQDIVRKDDAIGRMTEDCKRQEAILKEKTSGLEKMQTELNLKSAQYDDVKQKLDKKCLELNQLVGTH
jgi:DNA repair exonuclease SbcCD ATPase subunit